jgi:hypothetical protein
MQSTFLTLLAFLMGGGGSDLLDYVSPDAYWTEKQVAVSVESMAGELKPPAKADVSTLIDDLNSADPEARQKAGNKITETGPAALPALREALQSPSPQIVLTARSLITGIESANRPITIRRLMAIRELGDLKSKSGLPVLQALLQSPEPFVADYASAAIDEINGKPFTRRHPTNLRDDVWLLPGGCRAVGQILGPPAGPVAIEQMIKDIPVPPGQDRAMVTESVTHVLVDAAENLGNVRLEAISFGVAGDIGPKSGFVALIGRGRFDSHAVADLFHKQQVPSSIMGGVEIFQLAGAEMLIFFPSNDYAVLVGSPRGVELPVQQILDAISMGQGKLKTVPEMKKLIDGAPADQLVWAVAKITPAFAQAEILAPFETMELQTHLTKQGIRVAITATGNQPEKATAVAAIVSAGVKQAADSMAEEEKVFPPVRVVADAMAAAKCEAKNGNATLTSNIDASQSTLFILPMMVMGRAQRVSVAHPAATQPAKGPIK